MTKTEEERREQALDKLAVIGGKLKGEDDVIFQGSKFVLPTTVDLDGAINFLVQRRDDEQNDVNWTRVFPYRPQDGARATKLAIQEFAGFTMGQTLYSFFGRQLPAFVDIPTGPHEQDREQVPSGALKIPGLKGITVHLSNAKDAELGTVFRVVVEGPRKYRFHIEGLFTLIAKHLKEHSLYKGKAIDGAENFIDVFSVSPDDVVYTESVTRRLEGDVWAFIKYDKVLQQLGQDGKYAVLFEGPYGTGKSLAALLTAQVAVSNGWTFLMCRPGKDDLARTLETARMYQPAVVFAEDVDTMAGPNSGATIERHLDLLDGIKQKGLKLVTVFTTNHAEDIHKGMLRPGRIGAVISIGGMDRAGVEKLGRRVIGKALDPDTDWDKVNDAVDGYMPAFVREVFDRAVRYAISLNEGRLGKIGTEAICLAADGLRDQYRLMEGASEETRSVDLAMALERVVVDAVNGTEVKDTDNDSTAFVLASAIGNGH